MINVKELIEQQLKDTRLDILVFGPAISPPAADAYIASLQVKREEIKHCLIAEGHDTFYGEDVYDPLLPAHVADPLLQEAVAMRKADVIIVLLGAPGATLEAAHISHRPGLCQKTSFFCFEEHENGIVAQHLKATAILGGHFALVSLASVQACHLKTLILERVRAIHAAKAFLY